MAVTTKAIENVINNPDRLKAFTLSARKEKSIEEYAGTFAIRCFTLSKLNNTNKQKFAKFNELCVVSNADFSYLCQLLATNEDFKNYDYKANPILELYEELLEENWETIKNNRDILNDIDALDSTSKDNVKLCTAIMTFLKDYVLGKSHDVSL